MYEIEMVSPEGQTIPPLAVDLSQTYVFFFV